MAENRCPMCARLNPDHLDVCQFCQARLTPLIISDSSDESKEGMEKREDLPGWLGSEEDGETADSSFDDQEDAQEWLNRIRPDARSGEDDKLPDESDTDSDEGEISTDSDDWIKRIRALEESGEKSGLGEIDDSGEGEDRSRSHADIEEGDENVESPGEDLPDWLGRLDPIEDTGQPDEESELEETLPDWLRAGFEPEDESVSQPPGDIALPESSSAMQASDPGDEDWLTVLGEDTGAEGKPSGDYRVSETGHPESEQADSLPAWLKGSGDDQGFDRSDFSEASDATSTSDEEEALPAWLSNIGSGMEFEEEPTGGRDAEEMDSKTAGVENDDDVVSASDDDVPEWLASLGQIEPEETSGDVEEPVPAEIDDLQEWFSELEHAESAEDDAESSEPEIYEMEEEIPGWLKNLGSVVSGTVEDDSTSDVPKSPVSPFVEEEMYGDDLLDVEGLPEWLTPDIETRDEAQPEEPEIAPADLPGWLAAMRPADERAPSEYRDDGAVESAGPLAGLRGILPAEPDILHFKKPTVYSAKLKITESQQSHMEVIQQVIDSEGRPESIPEPPVISTQRAFRWIIAFLFIIGIGLVVLGGSQVVPYPAINSIPDEILAVSKIISGIPDQAPVLIAFDYEPGTSGEMHATAAALMDHLMLRGTRLALISTLSTGPGLGEYFIQDIQSQHKYVSGEQYLNLGYIPGGAPGLLSFAQTPKWVIQYSYEGMDPWESQVLQDIENLSDFAVFVILTDDLDVARAWIEQVQPRIGDTPLLMVVSAQIEPMIRPYFGEGQNSQVAGMIGGITGGVAYEVVVGKPNLGREYWDAFSLGLVLIVAIILIGGAINTFRELLTQNKASDQEGLG